LVSLALQRLLVVDMMNMGHGSVYRGTYAEDLDVMGGRITWCENTSEIPLSQIIFSLQTQYSSTELSPNVIYFKGKELTCQIVIYRKSML